MKKITINVEFLLQIQIGATTILTRKINKNVVNGILGSCKKNM
jgi:hypothetical protein